MSLCLGEPNALVGVSAVDRAAYFLFNETRIVKDTMFDAMDDYDQGCVRNGGSDTRSVYIVNIAQLREMLYSSFSLCFSTDQSNYSLNNDFVTLPQ